LFGAVLGPAALVLLELAPPGRCWSCAAPTLGWMTMCPWCGEDIREPAPEPEVAVAPVHAPLTVIEGSAPAASARSRTTRRGTIRAPGPGFGAAVPTRRRTSRAVIDEPNERRSRVASASLEPAADPVHRLKTRLGGNSSLAAAEAEAVEQPDSEPANRVLASAVYVTGSRGLLAGSRYGIALAEGRLEILGPVDVDPSAVALTHGLNGIDATGLQGRLVITAGEGRRDRLALVFMSVAGGSAEGVADSIVAAARDRRAGPR
jgi:hypothetical protein